MAELKKEEIIDEKEDEKVVEELEQFVNEERKTVENNINSLIGKLKNVSTLSDAENYLLSYRHQYVDKLAQYKNMRNRARGETKMARKGLLSYYKRGNVNLRLNSNEMKEFVEADLRFKTRLIECIEAHVNFLSESIETLDKMSFAIKHKYDFQTYF